MACLFSSIYLFFRRNYVLSLLHFHSYAFYKQRYKYDGNESSTKYECHAIIILFLKLSVMNKLHLLIREEFQSSFYESVIQLSSEGCGLFCLVDLNHTCPKVIFAYKNISKKHLPGNSCY